MTKYRRTSFWSIVTRRMPVYKFTQPITVRPLNGGHIEPNRHAEKYGWITMMLTIVLPHARSKPGGEFQDSVQKRKTSFGPIFRVTTTGWAEILARHANTALPLPTVHGWYRKKQTTRKGAEFIGDKPSIGSTHLTRRNMILSRELLQLGAGWIAKVQELEETTALCLLSGRRRYAYYNLVVNTR